MRSIGRWPVAGVSARGGLLFAAACALAAGAGCGRSTIDLGGGGWDASTYAITPQEPAPVDAPAGSDGLVRVGDGGTCTAVIESHPDEGATHIPCTSPAVYMTNPPSSGNHYPIWAAYQTYTSLVPWGNLVHCLEHGAIVIVYNCPAGCADEVARAQAWIDALPADPACGTNRLVLAPDPALDVRWGASAWTWTLRSDCFDETAFTQFFTDHYNMGRELVCGGGANTPDTLCPPP